MPPFSLADSYYTSSIISKARIYLVSCEPSIFRYSVASLYRVDLGLITVIKIIDVPTEAKPACTLFSPRSLISGDYAGGVTSSKVIK